MNITSKTFLTYWEPDAFSDFSPVDQHGNKKPKKKRSKKRLKKRKNDRNMMNDEQTDDEQGYAQQIGDNNDAQMQDPEIANEQKDAQQGDDDNDSKMEEPEIPIQHQRAGKWKSVKQSVYHKDAITPYVKYIEIVKRFMLCLIYVLCGNRILFNLHFMW